MEELHDGELREMILDEWHKIEKCNNFDTSEYNSRYVKFPFYVDGVIDNAIFDTRENKFTELHISYATDGDPTIWGGFAVYADAENIVAKKITL